MSYYQNKQYSYAHKLKRALIKRHRFAYGAYLAELAYERQRALAKYRVPSPPTPTQK